MARRSKLEDLVLSWFPKERVILNSRKLLPSKKEIDIYFPKYKIGVEINGSIWHSEAMGKTKNQHRDKFIECRRNGINLLSFTDLEVKSGPHTVKATIEREMGLSFNLRYEFIKYCTADDEDIVTFYKENSLINFVGGIHTAAIMDKKGLAAILSFYILEDKLIFANYTERNGLHILGGIAKLCDDVRKLYPEKSSFIKIINDYGHLYYRTLRDNGYKQIGITEPYCYYIKGSKMLPSNTKEDTYGYTKVYNSGEVIFAPISQSEEENIRCTQQPLTNENT